MSCEKRIIQQPDAPPGPSANKCRLEGIEADMTFQRGRELGCLACIWHDAVFRSSTAVEAARKIPLGTTCSYRG